MLAEDHRTLREGLKMLLEVDGDIEVVAEAESGREAVAVAQSSGADVVLMDVALVGLDGIEATRLLRAAAATAEDPVRALTDREYEILQIIAGGHSNREIAEMLGLSIKTIETHRMHLMEKLDIHDVASLTRYALRKGLIE